MTRTSSKAQLPLPERLSALVAGPEAAEKRRAQQHQPGRSSATTMRTTALTATLHPAGTDTATSKLRCTRLRPFDRRPAEVSERPLGALSAHLYEGDAGDETTYAPTLPVGDEGVHAYGLPGGQA
ncbi:hypothetical protein N4G70_35020 [Streptomyces sp. ASQP_92]|uniref:hypothetical protein n=1 Tax=Streptomyces sp. ASQP_92 TaxID=2979116 RepID=UPI0021C09183|nr:hypothetical protein [Streptomyces sp. ASQP_92]MCT9094030.1 hypothetical protein [Streptomyces sp. ASQP_92]